MQRNMLYLTNCHSYMPLNIIAEPGTRTQDTEKSHVSQDRKDGDSHAKKKRQGRTNL